jgi:hypothetical protein
MTEEVNEMARKASDTITKTCTRTGFKFTGTPDEVAEFFYRDKSQKDGFSPWCKDAERAYNKAYSASLSKAKVTRKADADAKGKATYDRSMKAMGARTTRKAKAKDAPKASRARTTKARANAKDGTRSRAAKARTTTRRTARAAKKA